MSTVELARLEKGSETGTANMYFYVQGTGVIHLRTRLTGYTNLTPGVNMGCFVGKSH